jgi:hypothetical protein
MILYMNEKSFSPQIEQALRNAGWVPNRELSIEELSDWLILDCDVPLVIFPAAYAVLKEFGGLRIAFDYGSESYILNFDPTLSVTIWFQYGWLLGQPIFPLGICHFEGDETNEVRVGIDVSGRIWVFAYDPFFAGNNIQEAIEWIAANEEKHEDESNFVDKGYEPDEIRDAIVKRLETLYQ